MVKVNPGVDGYGRLGVERMNEQRKNVEQMNDVELGLIYGEQFVLLIEIQNNIKNVRQELEKRKEAKRSEKESN